MISDSPEILCFNPQNITRLDLYEYLTQLKIPERTKYRRSKKISSGVLLGTTSPPSLQGCQPKVQRSASLPLARLLYVLLRFTRRIEGRRGEDEKHRGDGFRTKDLT